MLTENLLMVPSTIHSVRLLLKGLDRFITSVLLLLISASLATFVIPFANALYGSSIQISLARTTFGVGEPVAVQIRLVDSYPRSVRLIFSTPAGGINYNVGTVNPNVVYTATVSGVTAMPGACSVRAEVTGGEETQTSNTVSFVVGGGYSEFDFSLDLSPSFLTIEQGGTAIYRIQVTYKDPSYSGTSISIQVTGLGPGMTYTVSGDLAIRTSSTTPLGTYTITVIGSARGVTRQASATLIVGRQTPPPASFDFSISITPSTQTFDKGAKMSIRYSVTVSLVSGSPASVSLTLSGLPGGAGYSFTPQSSTPPFTSELLIDAATFSSTGSYTLTVTATGGGLSRTATAIVVAKEPADFTISVSPTAGSAKQGEKVSYSIAVNPLAGFNEIVSLTATGLPIGCSCLFTVPSNRPPFTTILTITLSSSASEGSYPITIRGDSISKIQSAAATLNVEKNPTLVEQLTSQPVVLLFSFVAIGLGLLGLAYTAYKVYRNYKIAKKAYEVSKDFYDKGIKPAVKAVKTAHKPFVEKREQLEDSMDPDSDRAKSKAAEDAKKSKAAEDAKKRKAAEDAKKSKAAQKVEEDAKRSARKLADEAEAKRKAGQRKAEQKKRSDETKSVVKDVARAIRRKMGWPV